MVTTWDIDNVKSVEKEGDLTDVCKEIFYVAREQVNVSGQEHGGNINGSVVLADPDPSSYVDYSTLTSDDLIKWVKNTLGSEKISSIEKSIAEQIAASKESSGTNIKSGLPWR